MRQPMALATFWVVGAGVWDEYVSYLQTCDVDAQLMHAMHCASIPEQDVYVCETGNLRAFQNKM